MVEEIEALERLGWYQEHYRVMAARYDEWNWGVWNGSWQLTHATCDLCHSDGECIQVRSVPLCLPCLSEFPNTPWHPTGSVRPKVPVLLQIEAQRRGLSQEGS